MPPSIIAYFDIYIGDQGDHEALLSAYQRSEQHFRSVASRYGLDPQSRLAQVDEESRELLEESSEETDDRLSISYASTHFLARSQTRLHTASPASQRSSSSLHPSSPGLSKTRENFLNLVTGSKGFSKADKTRKLHYQDTTVHRIEKDFVAQGGDVTRNDGSGGGATIGSGIMKAESEGLSVQPKYASLCMANSGRRDSITSQFFIVLARSESSLRKLGGRQYVNFGNAICLERSESEEEKKAWEQEGSKVLKEMERVATETGTPKEKVWIGDCGLIER